MTGWTGASVAHHTLDPADGRALGQAIDRLPAQAIVTGPDPLTPSVRAVLDRFLSVPLRGVLRSIGPVDGPAAVVIDGLAIGPLGSTRPDATPALLAWVVEAAGLFPAESVRRCPGTVVTGPGSGADHRLEWALRSPPRPTPPVRFAVTAEAIARLDRADVDTLGRRRFEPVGQGRPARPTEPRPLIRGSGHRAGLLDDPERSRGTDDGAEAVRRRFLGALTEVEIEIEYRAGRLLLADERRGRVAPPQPQPVPGEGWLHRVDLTADPRAERTD